MNALREFASSHSAAEGKIGGEMYIAKPLNVKGVISVIERTLGK